MITIKVDPQTLKEIEETYADFITERNIGYIIFVAKTDKNIITAYENRKGVNFKVTIQGDGYLELAKKYSLDKQLLPKTKKGVEEAIHFIDIDSQIGSDEVGTGSFLGPVVVCAAYVGHDTMKVIDTYGVKDSKKMSDETILRIAPMLLKKVIYEYKVLSNKKYNDGIAKNFNANRIKCVLHNHVLLKLHERFPTVKNVYVDQFCPAETYYKHLDGMTNIEKGIVFKEKAESYFPSVALASIIARYYFLIEIDRLSKQYGMKFPTGAGKDVDEFAIEFVKKYGLDEFKNLCKRNFRNYITLTTSLN